MAGCRRQGSATNAGATYSREGTDERMRSHAGQAAQTRQRTRKRLKAKKVMGRLNVQSSSWGAHSQLRVHSRIPTPVPTLLQGSGRQQGATGVRGALPGLGLRRAGQRQGSPVGAAGAAGAPLQPRDPQPRLAPHPRRRRVPRVERQLDPRACDGWGGNRHGGGQRRDGGRPSLRRSPHPGRA